MNKDIKFFGKCIIDQINDDGVLYTSRHISDIYFMANIKNSRNNKTMETITAKRLTKIYVNLGYLYMNKVNDYFENLIITDKIDEKECLLGLVESMILDSEFNIENYINETKINKTKFNKVYDTYLKNIEKHKFLHDAVPEVLFFEISFSNDILVVHYGNFKMGSLIFRADNLLDIGEEIDFITLYGNDRFFTYDSENYKNSFIPLNKFAKALNQADLMMIHNQNIIEGIYNKNILNVLNLTLIMIGYPICSNAKGKTSESLETFEKDILSLIKNEGYSDMTPFINIQPKIFKELDNRHFSTFISTNVIGHDYKFIFQQESSYNVIASILILFLLLERGILYEYICILNEDIIDTTKMIKLFEKSRIPLGQFLNIWNKFYSNMEMNLSILEKRIIILEG